MKKMWEEQRKKVLYFLYILSTLSYISAFVLFLLAFLPHYDAWKWEYQQIIQMKLSAGFFILGMVCAEISGFLTISERNGIIEEKERRWTEKEKIEIEKLLLELDDERKILSSKP